MQNTEIAGKKLLNAEVVSNVEVADGHFVISLLCPHIAYNSVPGQFVQVRVNNLSEPLLPRPLAVYRAREDIFDILFYIVGKGTKLLSEKRPGDRIKVIGPLGNGFPLDDDFQQVIMVAGGIGVAPFVMLAEALEGKQITALIGASTSDRIVGDQDMLASGAEVLVATEDGTAGHKGLVTDLLQDALIKGECVPEECRIYACGPMPMLKAVAQIADRHRIETYVSLESNMACGVGACLGCVCETVSSDGQVKYETVCATGPVFNVREILWK